MLYWVCDVQALISWAWSIMDVYDEATPYIAITKGFRFGKYLCSEITLNLETKIEVVWLNMVIPEHCHLK